MRSPPQTTAKAGARATRRPAKCELKRINTKFYLDREIPPILHRKRRPSRSFDVTTLKILESASLESDDTTRSGPETCGRSPATAYHCSPRSGNSSKNKNRRRRRERRFLMTPTMLEGDCHEIRRLYSMSNLYSITGLGGQQERKKSISPVTSREQLSKEQDGSSECLDECLQLVKDLNLLGPSPGATSSPASSP